jgi:hypothetical protein
MNEPRLKKLQVDSCLMIRVSFSKLLKGFFSFLASVYPSGGKVLLKVLLNWQTISKQKIITALFKSKQKLFFAPHRSDFSSVLKQFLRSTQF